MTQRKFKCDKLVRDKTCERMIARGIGSECSILDDACYRQGLRAKLIEEAHEVVSAVDRLELVSELADILEVAYALCKVEGVDPKEVEEARQQKLVERGGFEKRLYVSKITIDKNNPEIKYFEELKEKYPEVIEET